MSNEQNQQGAPRSLWYKFIPALAVLALSLGVAYFGPQVYDMVLASQFHPSAQITATRDRLKLTARGAEIFYATRPAVQQKDTFNKSCQSTERTAAILGCYFKDRIYLYDIQNKELDGTLEVTAAHETLHAGYHRLSLFERPRIDELVRVEYQKIKDQPAIKQMMNYYQVAEPGAEADELHSIIGTTVRDLDPDLERYYTRYFADRSAVVSLNESYNRVFNELSQKATTLQESITRTRGQLEADLAAYQADLEQVNLDIQTFNQRASGGDFATRAEFQIARSALVSRVDLLQVRQRNLNQRVESLNADIATLNAIAVHVNQLNESINGAPAPTGVAS